MAKSSKIVVSKRTEAQFRAKYGYRSKNVQSYINSILKDRADLFDKIQVLEAALDVADNSAKVEKA